MNVLKCMQIKTLHDGDNFLILNQVQRRSQNRVFQVLQLWKTYLIC